MTALRRGRVAAPAKVNLLLRVLGRRPDGFHDLETLFQAVDLSDEVEVTTGGEGVRLRVEGPDLGPVRENLAYRAALGFLERTGLAGEGVEIQLRKRIPAGAGLGGGSSDAAAVLRCLDALWPGMVAPAARAELALDLGSDVPFFLGPAGLALGRGRGERLTPISPLPTGHLVIVLPPVHVATAWAYGALAGFRRERPFSRRVPLGEGPWRWDDVAGHAGNDFEEVVSGAHPRVAASLTALRDAGARPALLSGSGAACFGVFTGAEEAGYAASRIGSRLGWPAVAARTLPELPDVEVD